MTNSNCATLLYYFLLLSHTHNTIMACLYIVIAVITLCFNLLLTAALFGTRQAFRNTSYILITFVSIVDCINGGVSLPLLALIRFDQERLSDCIMATVSQIIPLLFGYLSSLITILIAIDRYMHMNPSLDRKRSFIQKLFRGKWIIIPITGAVILAVAIPVAYKVFSEFGKLGIILTVAFSTLVKLISIPGVAALYLHGYLRVRRFVKKSSVHLGKPCKLEHKDAGKEEGDQAHPTKNKPVYLKNLHRTVFMLVISLMVTYIPYIIAATTLTLFFLAGDPPWILLLFYDITGIIYFSNFTINSLIVFKMNKKLCLWVQGKWQCCRPNERLDVSKSSAEEIKTIEDNV